MFGRGKRRRWLTALALAAALAVPAAPARAAGPETAGGLVGVWDRVWQWVAAALVPVIDPDAAKADRSSFIDPNG
jgi:hypothetical protein